MGLADEVIQSAQRLSQAVQGILFLSPVTHVYNPLQYAWAAHELYLQKYADTPKQVIFLGMNPGPWGMAQTGVPFGEVACVRDWLQVAAPVCQPARVHPKRPIEGFSCGRSEVSGRRLWGLFKERFGLAEVFFKDHFVANYCPLVFMEETGRNRTPDKLSSEAVSQLYAACDVHLKEVVTLLKPTWLVGVGGFAEERAKAALYEVDVQVGRILHPSPASPVANRGWAEKAVTQLMDQGIW